MWFNKRFYPLCEEEPGGEGDKGAGGGEGDKGAGGGNEFLNSIPEDLRSSPALQDIKDIGSLAKSFVETKSMVGNSIRIPGEDASDEAVGEFITKLVERVPSVMLKPNMDNEVQSKEFYKTIGVPDTVDGYKQVEIEIPDGVNFNHADLIANAKKIAHEANLTNVQFEKVVKSLASDIIANIQEVDKQAGEAYEILKTKWGSAHDQNWEIAANIAKKTGMPDSVLQEIANKEIDPEIMVWLHSLSKQFDPEGKNFSKEGQSNDRLTPEEARARISEINNNPKHPYWNSSDPAHADALQNMLKLQRMSSGG